MNKDKRPYVPANYSVEHSYSALFAGMVLDVKNPVTKHLMQVVDEKYAKLGVIAQAALMQMYRGVETGMTYETLFDKLAKQIHGRMPATPHFGNKVAESISNLLAADLIYLTSSNDGELILSPVLRILFNQNHEMRMPLHLGLDIYPPETKTDFPLMQLNLIGNAISGTANVPSNSMFVGSTLAGHVVPPGEMFSVFKQISKDPQVASALAGGAHDTTYCMTVKFNDCEWPVNVAEAYNYYVWFTDLTGMLLPEGKSPLLYLGNQEVSAEDSVAYYQDIEKAIFLTETLSKNYRYKPSIGALVGWSFTFEQIRQFKRDFDAMLVLTGNKEAPNQKTQVTAKFVLCGVHVPVHSARDVYDFLAGNADIQKYRTCNGEDFAHADVVVNYRGNDHVITAAQGSKFMDDFKDLKKALKKPKVE